MVELGALTISQESSSKSKNRAKHLPVDDKTEGTTLSHVTPNISKMVFTVFLLTFNILFMG